MPVWGVSLGEVGDSRLVTDDETGTVQSLRQFGYRHCGEPGFATTAYQPGGTARTGETMPSGHRLGVSVVGDEKASGRADFGQICQRLADRRPGEVNGNTDPDDDTWFCRVETGLIEALGQTITLEIAWNPMDPWPDSAIGALQQAPLFPLGGWRVNLEDRRPGVSDGGAQTRGVKPCPQQDYLIDSRRDSVLDNIIGISDTKDDVDMQPWEVAVENAKPHACNDWLGQQGLISAGKQRRVGVVEQPAMRRLQRFRGALDRARLRRQACISVQSTARHSAKVLRLPRDTERFRRDNLR